MHWYCFLTEYKYLLSRTHRYQYLFSRYRNTFIVLGFLFYSTSACLSTTRGDCHKFHCTANTNWTHLSCAHTYTTGIGVVVSARVLNPGIGAFLFYSYSAEQFKPLALNQSHCSICTITCWVSALKETAALDVYGEWVPVDKTPGKAPSKTTAATNSTSASTMTSSDTVAAAGVHDALQQPAMVADADCVFNDQTLQVSRRR